MVSKPVLLTGGAGFVGRQVLAALTAAGVPVRLVLREGRAVPAGQVEGVRRTPDLFAEPVEWWQDACQGVGTIVHAAWYAEPGKYLQSSLNLHCLAGTLRLAQGAVEAGVGRVVGVGTCFEYDLADGLLDTATPVRPLTPYAGAKAATYFALSTSLPSHNLSFAWCRLFYLYGPHEDTRRLAPYVRMHVAAGEPVDLTSGAQVRDFLDVREAGRLIAAVALGQHEGPVNICSGVPITVRAFAERIADEYGRRDLLRFGTRPDNLVDPAVVIGVRDEAPFAPAGAFPETTHE